MLVTERPGIILTARFPQTVYYRFMSADYFEEKPAANIFADQMIRSGAGRNLVKVKGEFDSRCKKRSAAFLSASCSFPE